MAKKLTKSKAKEILEDGTAHDKTLTKKQKRYFGYIANAQNGTALYEGYTDKGFNYNSAWGGSFQEGGNLNTIRKGAPSNGKYAKKTLPSAEHGMTYYQHGLDFKPKNISRNGKVIKDNRGQWNHPGEVTQIDSNNITMQNVPYPVLGVSNSGDVKLMTPNNNYLFEGGSVTEYPLLETGGSIQDKGQLQKLDQLTNFTNYNMKAKSGMYIKSENKGKFNATKKKTGKTTEELTHSKNPLTRKRAIFAQNAAKWKHEEGGLIPYAQQGIDMSMISPQGSTPINLTGSVMPQNTSWDLNQFSNIQTPSFNQPVQNQSQGSNTGGTNMLGQLGGGAGITNKVGNIIKGVQMIKEEKKQKQKAQQFAALSDVVEDASSIRPDKPKRKYVRPEDQITNPNELFPTYGVGTNYLAKNGKKIKGNPSEIQNLYNPGDIYKDLGYVPIAQSGIEAFANAGGTDLGAQVGQIGGGLLSGSEFGSPSGGSYLGSEIGGTLGTFFGPAGSMIGSAAGGLIGGLLDKNPKKIKKFTEEGQANMQKAAFQQGAQSIQDQYTGFMENGGNLTNPQLITKFNGMDITDVHNLFVPKEMDTLRTGGHIRQNYMQLGGDLKTHWGGYAETMSQNPYLPDTGETVMFKGQSHNDTDGKGRSGIGVTFGENPVEVERGEPAVKLQNGGEESLTVFGNMKIPTYGVSELGDKKAKGKKFKTYVDDLSKIEGKQNKIIDKNTQIINETPIYDSFDKLKFSSSEAMLTGADMKLKEIATKKQIAANVQNAILETADEFNIDSDYLAKGKIKKAKKGAKIDKAQVGWAKVIESGKLPESERNTFLAQNPGWKPIGGGLLEKATTSTQYKQPTNVDPEFNAWFAQEYKKNPGGISYYQNRPIKLELGENKDASTKKDYISIYGDEKPFSLNVDTKALGKMNIKSPQFKTIPIPEQQVTNITDAEATNDKVNKFGWLDAARSIIPLVRPTDQEPLDPTQLSGEMFALASNQLEPVQSQLYRPLLEQPYDISLQDQLNANQSTFNALKRQVGNNPAALSSLAAQKYAADSNVLSEQFRQNQGMKAGVYNRNRQTLNDAQLKNLGILDTQYTRQSQAKSNTKAVAQQALNSISDKILKNKLENKTLGVYENLYNYRYDDKGRAWNWNSPVDFEGMVANASNPELVEIDEKPKTKKKKATNGAILKQYRKM